MDAGSGPAGGSGFGELAKFLFGGNSKQLSMEMTTPVLSTAGQAGEGGNRMAFVMSGRFKAPEELPAPNSSRVMCKTSDPGVVAAIEFTGWPLDFEVLKLSLCLASSARSVHQDASRHQAAPFTWQVVNAESELRAALIKDGFNPLPGYQVWASHVKPCTAGHAIAQWACCRFGSWHDTMTRERCRCSVAMKC